MATSTQHTYTRITGDLTHRFDGVFTREEVAATVAQVHAELETPSRPQQFLPALVEKTARERLLVRAASATHGPAPHPVPSFLFVSRRNEGRSQMAAAIAAHLAAVPLRVEAAGSTSGGGPDPVIVQALAERGITLTHAYPTPADGDVLAAADVVVAMEPSLVEMPGRHHVQWAIEDPHHRSLEIVREIRDDIEARVVELLGAYDVPLRTGAPTPVPAPARLTRHAHRPLRDRLHLVAHA